MSTIAATAGRTPPSTLEKAITLFVVVAPFLAVLAIPFVWEWARVAASMWMLPIFSVLTIQAITISLHRELTHGALRLKPLARYTEAFLALCSIEGRIKDWCTDHRMHHAKTDKEGDPHSPVEGFIHAHFGWFFDKGKPDHEHWVPDLLKDRGLMLLDKLWPFIAVFSFVIPGLIVLVFEPNWRGFLTGVFWGGFVRVFLVHHITWSINSVCHIWGTRPFHSNDQSTNLFIFGLLGAGEGWHRNHHAFSWSAKIGLRWWEFDWGWLVIRLLSLFGLVEWVKVPTTRQIEAKLVSR